MKAKPGEIWLADLGLAAKRRPVLIVSRHDPEAPRALLAYVPLTTQHRNSRYEIPIGRLPFLDQLSVINVQGIGALVEPHLEHKLASFPRISSRRSKQHFGSYSTCNSQRSCPERAAASCTYRLGFKQDRLFTRTMNLTDQDEQGTTGYA